MSKELSADVAKKFFASLYAEPVATKAGDFDAVVTRIVAGYSDKVVAGDQALQGLMINYALSHGLDPKKQQSLVASLAGIKQRSIADFTNAFPSADLASLIAEAEKNGFQVEVLKTGK